METLDRLAEKLRAVGIELPRAGVAWPSSPGADLRGGEITLL